MTREDAIRWLEEQGFVGSKRDWSFGETVIAAAGKTDASGIVILQHPLCIHPHNGAWAITDFSRVKSEIVVCESLQQATQKAAATLAGRLRATRQPLDSPIDE